MQKPSNLANWPKNGSHNYHNWSLDIFISIWTGPGTKIILSKICSSSNSEVSFLWVSSWTVGILWYLPLLYNHYILDDGLVYQRGTYMEFHHYVEKSIFYHGHYPKDVLHCKMHIFSGVRVYYNWFPYYNFSWILRLVVNSSIVWIKFSIMDIFIIAARPNIEIIFKCVFTVAAHINC